EVGDRYKSSDPKHLLVREWELAHVAQMILRYSRRCGTPERRLSEWRNFSTLVGLWYELEERFHRDFVPSREIIQEMSRIGSRQFFWQGLATNRQFGRYARIYNHPTLAPLLVERSGHPPDELLLASFALMSVVSPRYENPLPLPVPPPLERLRSAIFQQMETLGASLQAHRKAARKNLEGARDHPIDASLIYRPVTFFDQPIVVDRHSNFFCAPLPSLVFNRGVSGIYYDHVGRPEFGNPLGDAYQGYVGDLIREHFDEDAYGVHPEEKYKHSRGESRTTDWVLVEPGRAALFLECKAARPQFAALQSIEFDDAKAKDVEKLAESVIQAFKQIIAARRGASPLAGNLTNEKLFVVVSLLGDWYFFPQTYKEQIRDRVRSAMARIDADYEALLTEIPFTFASASETENLLSVAAQIGLRLSLDAVFDRGERLGSPVGPAVLDISRKHDCAENYPHSEELTRVMQEFGLRDNDE
ncbi:MAG: hypothetical protein PVI23_08320, partial [Maricaulaceae bacterium]